MGGVLAIQVAAQRPDLVEQLVLAAPAARPSGRHTLRSYVLPLAAAIPAMHPTFLPILVHDALRAGPRTLVRLTRDIIVYDARDELARIEAPTLLVWGERDTLVPPSLGPQMCEALSHAELRVVRGAGHVVMYDRPAAFDATVLAFFAGQLVRQRQPQYA
jgi:pimeloyl-ACP methyl ester carboxylesterase